MDPLTVVEHGSDPVVVPTGLEAALAGLGGQIQAVRSAAGRILRAQETYEVTALRARLSGLRETLAALDGAAVDAERALAAVPAGQALGAGYAAALEAELRRVGLTFEGAFPDYEIFPLTLRVHAESESVRIGRRPITTLAPRAVALAVQREHRRLYASPFNATRFLDALMLCYDALSGGEAGASVLLYDAYRLLSARTGSGGYTRQEFAFDIFRLRRSSELTAKDRTLAFTHGKSGTKIEVPRALGGVEVFTAMTVRKVAGGGG